ncbi:hypothetical protein [Streptomyces sedi]|uniref:Uncharacterized protein n=1 Tax=Streptomyces sedi TaxID=555059 RepID=A0A5C4V184_9ACTN|nr:hypothetical protein [Streptomyces sedi]TNM29458.1 hypothetical protein FH715_15065 [Streptomyces sedi]
MNERHSSPVPATGSVTVPAPAPGTGREHIPTTPQEPPGHAEFRAFRVLAHRTTPVPTKEHR